MLDPVICCIDIECTGLDPTVDRICEVAKALYDASTRTLKNDAFSRGVNPGIPIPPEASAVHHLTDEMVANCPTWAEVEPEFSGHAIYAAHNSRFEQSFLRWPAARWVDTYRVSLVVYPDAPGHSLFALYYWLKLGNSPRMAANVAHSALGDAIACSALLQHLHQTMTINEMLKISSVPALLPRLTFGKHAKVPAKDVPRGYWEWVIRNGDFDEDVLHTARHWIAEGQR